MNTNSFFDINRLKHLVLRQIFFNHKNLLIATAVVVGIVLFSGIVSMVFSDNSFNINELQGSIFRFFIIGGYIFTSIIFTELNAPHRGYLYLTLPASTFEKLMSAWLTTTIIYVMYSIIVIYMINILFWLFAVLVLSKSIEFINVFSIEMLKTYGVYMVTQSVFLLGAIYFRKSNFFKTLLTVFVCIIGIILFIGISAKLLFNSVSFNNMWFNDHFSKAKVEHYKYVGDNVLKPIGEFLFWGAMAPFFLTVAYFRLKEREV